MLVWRSIPGDDVSYSDNIIHHHCFCFVLFFLTDTDKLRRSHLCHLHFGAEVM